MAFRKNNDDKGSNYQLSLVKTRLNDVESELEEEKATRTAAERRCEELEQEMDLLQEQLDETGGPNAAQASKKKDDEIIRLKTTVRDMATDHEESLTSLRTKFNQQIYQLSEEVEAQKKSKARIDKEKTSLADECSELNAEVNILSRTKESLEKEHKTMSEQVIDYKLKLNEAENKVRELETFKKIHEKDIKKLEGEIEAYAARIPTMERSISQLENELRKVKIDLDGEIRTKQEYYKELTDALRDLSVTEDRLAKESEAKDEVQTKFIQAVNESKEWKARYDMDMGAKVDEMEDLRRSLSGKLNDAETSLRNAEQKVTNLEKTKNDLIHQNSDLTTNLQSTEELAANYKEKLKKAEHQATEFKAKSEKLAADLDVSKTYANKISLQIPKLEDEIIVLSRELDNIRPLNRTLEAKLGETAEKLGETKKQLGITESKVEQLVLQRDDLNATIEVVENELDDERKKTVSLATDLANSKQDAERQLANVKDAMESMKKNLEFQIKELTDQVDKEIRAKQDNIKMRKLAEEQTLEYESQLDEAKMAISDQTKTIKQLQQSLKETEVAAAEAKKNYEETKKVALDAQDRADKISTEFDIVTGRLETSDRTVKMLEKNKQELSEQLKDITNQLRAQEEQKKELEDQVFFFKDEVRELNDEIKSSMDKAARLNNEITRLNGELERAIKVSVIMEEGKKDAEQRCSDLEERMMELEEIGTKLLKSEIRKLEQKVRDAEAGRDVETRRCVEAQKGMKRFEKKARDTDVELQESIRQGKSYQDQIDRHLADSRKLRQQYEEARAEADLFKTKYYKIQAELEDAEQRKDHAVKALMARARARNT
ncbi:myosin heavy chain-like isoform X2 [Rhopilema esculentum]|uniref:myosin heavy chain-like isoform X1 n=1 Tax=Rhopilema esculentum TaxID=499914 RepID=UPI0031E2CA6D|eukprot:gene9422-17137_t